MAHVLHGDGYCQVPWGAQATSMAALARSQIAASVSLPMPLGVVGWAGPEGLPMPIDPSIGEVRQLAPRRVRHLQNAQAPVREGLGRFRARSRTVHQLRRA